LRGSQKGWQDPLVYAFVLIAAGILIGAIGYKIISEKTLGDIGTLVALVGVLVILLKGIFLVIPPDARHARSPESIEAGLDENAQAEPLARGVPALLVGEPPSITEHTTKQLEPTVENEMEGPRNTQPTLQ
jgi:hypothetical protein